MKEKARDSLRQAADMLEKLVALADEEQEFVLAAKAEDVRLYVLSRLSDPEGVLPE